MDIIGKIIAKTTGAAGDIEGVNKKFGCKFGERSITIAGLSRKHKIARNTFTKYAKVVVED